MLLLIHCTLVISLWLYLISAYNRYYIIYFWELWFFSKQNCRFWNKIASNLINIVVYWHVYINTPSKSSIFPLPWHSNPPKILFPCIDLNKPKKSSLFFSFSFRLAPFLLVAISPNRSKQTTKIQNKIEKTKTK